MPGLKTILICTEDIIAGADKMQDKLGRLDLIGQILKTGYKIRIEPEARTPACQGTLVHPFTFCIRGRVQNSDITIKILKNANLSGIRQLELANDLLEEYDLYLEPMH